MRTTLHQEVPLSLTASTDNTERQLVHIVDDDEALRDSLVWLLESAGMAVAAYPSGTV